MPYEFNGNQYRTREEAEQAKSQYESDRKNRIASTYADAASVGFDENKFNMLMASGTGLSQMSKEERDYIRNRYAKSGAVDTYTKSATDQYLMSVGMPPSKSIDSYRKKYSEYSASGGFNENYGGVSNEQWQKINDLWKKDWEYGLTDADAQRKALGLAPVAYDDMYEDNLLDAELKEKGLPPSKLLNGKLGEKYREWENDAKQFLGFNDAVTRKMIENEGKLRSNDYEGDATGALGIAGAIVSNPNNKYSLQDAFEETANDPKWRDYATGHFRYEMTLPNHDDYYAYDDDTGEKYIDEEKYLKDWKKTQDNNNALAEDEFALTLDGIRSYYNENGALTKADMQAEQWFANRGIKIDYDNRYANEMYVNVMSDFYAGATLNDGEGYTLELLFPDTKFTDEERVALQPLIDEANKRRTEQGYAAGQEYLSGGSFSAALRQLSDDRIVARWHEIHDGDDPTNRDKSAEDILKMHYDALGKSYDMKPDEIEKLRNGEITIDQYLTQKCGSVEEAEAYAHHRLTADLWGKGLPTEKEDLVKLYEQLQNAENYIDTIVDNTSFEYNTNLVTMSDEEFEKYFETEMAKIEEYNWPTEQDKNVSIDHLKKEKEDVLAYRDTIKNICPSYYTGESGNFNKKSGLDREYYNSEYVGSVLNEWDATDAAYYAESVSYTPEFAAFFKDKSEDYINQRFSEIVGKYSNTGDNVPVELSNKYATEDEKRRLIYLADTVGTEWKERREFTSTSSVAGDNSMAFVPTQYEVLAGRGDEYLNNVLVRQWDAYERQYNAEKNAYWGHENDSWMVRTLGGGAAWMTSILASIPESTANFFADTSRVLQGYDILSSDRFTWSSDVVSSVAEDVGNSFSGKVGEFVVQSIPSMVHSGVSMWLAAHTGGASEAITLALMGMQSYSGAVDTALRNGATSGQAYVYGLLNGANEIIFEKMSLDKFIKDIHVVNAAVDAAFESGDFSEKALVKYMWKNIVKHMGTQGFVEGSEEVFTSLANLLAENIVLGYNSSYRKSVEHYMDGGMSEEDAKKLAGTEIVKGVVMDFVGGLISGTIMTFGNDMIQTKGGRYFIDRTGMTQFLQQTHDLSLISADDALNYAKQNLSKGAGGEYTLASTQAVFDGLRKKGADSSTLRRVMNELSDNATQGARTVMESAIKEQRAIDEKKLIKAASKYVYNKVNGKSNLTAGEVARVTNEYLDNLSTVVQQSDIRNVVAAARNMQAGYVEEIMAISGKGNVQTGFKLMNDYYESLPNEVKDQIVQNAVIYEPAFAHLTANGLDAGSYALAASVFEYATKSGDALTGLNSVFGESAAVASNAIVNACLNTSDATTFIDGVCAGIAMLQAQDGSHLFKAAQNGVNAHAYVASQMALAQAMPEQSLSRSMYDYIIKYGATSETMDLLTAANIYESQGATAKNISMNFGHFYAVSELAAITGAYEKAATNYNNKLKILEAHQQADATARAADEGHVAALEARVAEMQPLLESNTELATAYGKTAAELQSAKSALGNLIAEQNKRMSSTQADVESAKDAYMKARMTYQMAMREHSAQFIRHFGAQLEAIKGRQEVSHAELARMSALVTYGTAENLNDINAKIIASEKSAAVALGRALGATVQCASFKNEDFLREHNIPKSDWEKAKQARGFRDGGTIFLNEDVKTPEVGSLTNEVLLHEIGHYLENSVDNYKKYAKFAKDFWIARDGLETYNAAVAALGEDEMVAEFTRQIALADPRAVAALCKSAPKMSMRVFQWLTNTRNNMTSVAAAQSKIIRDAQRAFAKGLKAYRGNVQTNTKTNSESTVNLGPTRESLENALRALAECESYNEQNARQQPAQTNQQTQQQQTEKPAETQNAPVAEEQTSTTEEQQPTEETTAQPVAEETEQIEEAVEETPTEEPVSEEQTAEEPIAEEPKEDFADVDIEQENEYNKSKGDNSDGADQITSAENAAESERDVQGLSGPVEPAADRRSESGRADGRANPRLPESVRVTLSNRGITPVDLVSTEDAPNFYERIGKAKKLNPYGAFVTQHEIDEYSGMKLFLDGTGSVGVAVTNDGNIVSVFKNTNGNAPKGSVSSILLTALENGGIKLDNFNSSNLSRMYALHGFIPVSRTKFNDEFAPADWNYERDGRPDIVFWMHNGDSLQTIAENVGKYKDDYDYDSLPMFEDNDEGYGYDRAEAYRDAKLKETLDNAANEAGYNVEAYHGTSKGGFDVFDYGHMRYGLFGTGFYFTEDPEIAQTYTKKGKGKNPEVKHVRLNAHNEIDMDAKADVGEWIKSADDADFDLQPFIDEIAAEKGGVENLTNTDCFHALKNAIAYDGDVPDYEAGEITSGVIQSMGYDGITHIGGNRRGNGEHPHRVHIVFEQEQIKSADPVTYDKETGNAIPRSERFNRNKGSISYYTEYDPQALAVKRNIESLTNEQKQWTGNPRMIQTNNGYMVARKVSREGLATGNPLYNSKRQNIAMIAPVAEFPNGDVGKAVPVSRCTAVVMPNTDEYAAARADARRAGANVYPYDESDPTQFDRAIDRAANTKKVQFMPEMSYNEWLKRYGSIKKGTSPRVDRPVPKQTTDTNRVSRMVRTGMEAPVTSEETAERIRGSWLPNGTGTFEPVSNAKTLNKARGIIERAGSISQAAQDLHRDVANGSGRATDLLARAELLYAEMQDPNSDLTDEEREKIFGDMVIIASDAGRALQLSTELKRMTPDGHIAYIEQVGKRMEDRYNKRTGKRTHIELTEEEKAKYHRAVTQKQREEVDGEVAKRWADETSDLTLLDRIRNWRYFAMLGNPRTHFRNMVGNALMNPVARAKDVINAGYQAMAGIDKADRTSAAWVGRVDAATKQWVNERLKEALPVMQGVSSKYMEEASTAKPDTDLEGGWFKRTIAALTQPVQSARLSNADNKWGRFWNKLSYANSNALEMEDALALGMRFRSVMYQLIKARDLNINTMTEQQQKDIMDVAMAESLKATFRDASKLADALNRFANTNKATQFAMEAIVPFRKTPINIAKRSFEYSPIGLVNGFYKLFSNSAKYNNAVKSINADTKLTVEERQKQLNDEMRDFKRRKIEAIDRLAQGTTGSFMTALGIFAASMGWISIGRKDDEEAAFEQALGKNNYSLNIGDVSIDLSAFSPAAVPMLMGTALYQSLGAEQDPNLVSALISVLAESIDPITEMSMISGIADALSGIGSQREDGANTRWAMQIAGNALQSYIGQFVPTFVGQTERAFDPYARSYTAGDEYWASKVFGSEIGSSVKNLQNKAGLGWLSEPKVNLHGEQHRNFTNFGAWVLNAANNWILPATIKMDQKNDIDDELVRLYGSVDSADIYPTKPSRNLGVYTDKKTGKKKQIKITSDSEYMQYSMEYGQTVYDMLDDLMRSPKYKRMTDEQKAEAVADVIDQAKSATRKRWKAQKVANMK